MMVGASAHHHLPTTTSKQPHGVAACRASLAPPIGRRWPLLVLPMSYHAWWMSLNQILVSTSRQVCSIAVISVGAMPC